jgi:UDP-N-acetylglucosamine pyrophosphorylase
LLSQFFRLKKKLVVLFFLVKLEKLLKMKKVYDAKNKKKIMNQNFFFATQKNMLKSRKQTSCAWQKLE